MVGSQWRTEVALYQDGQGAGTMSAGRQGELQRLSGATGPPLGERGTLSPAVDEVEALRMRILKEAEMNFEKELKRLGTRRETGDTNSYKTSSSGTQGLPEGEPPLHGLPQRPPAWTITSLGEWRESDVSYQNWRRCFGGIDNGSLEKPGVAYIATSQGVEGLDTI